MTCSQSPDTPSYFSIDGKKCRGDGFCVAVCPHLLFELKPGAKVPTPVPGGESRCIKCGHCVAVCPHDALSVGSITPGECPPFRTEMRLSEEHVEHFLRTRRSIRVFREKKVERHSIARLIEVARYAPTGSNRQNVGWVVIDSAEEIRKLSGIAVDMLREMRQTFPETFPVENYIKGWESGIDVIARGAPVLILSHTPRESPVGQVDATIAMTFLDLAAPSFGLGAFWGGFFMLGLKQWPPLQEAVGLPGDRVCQGVMLAGYPKYAYRRLPPRNEPLIEWR